MLGGEASCEAADSEVGPMCKLCGAQHQIAPGTQGELLKLPYCSGAISGRRDCGRTEPALSKRESVPRLIADAVSACVRKTNTEGVQCPSKALRLSHRNLPAQQPPLAWQPQRGAKMGKGLGVFGPAVSLCRASLNRSILGSAIRFPKGPRLEEMNIPAEDRLQARDVELCLWPRRDHPPPCTDQSIFLYKERWFLSNLTAAIDTIAPKRIVELGIYYGGSAIYWENRYRPERIALFDLMTETPHLSRYIERNGLADVFRMHLGVLQDDRAALHAAVAQDFGGNPIDLVVDDCSHEHAPTRTSFETLFPYLRPGGLYVIEDWAWGHEGDWPPELWADRPLMSPLLSEIMLICGKHRGVVTHLDIYPFFALVWRGEASLPTDGSFKLTDHYTPSRFPGLS